MIHQVQPKDNLYRIGLKYRTSAEEIRILNGLKNYDIYSGQILKIPVKTTERKDGSILRLSDLCITSEPLPLDVADSLALFHFLPIQKVITETGLNVWASKKSGYRPESYELATGRGGGSQHTFKEFSAHGSGAVDWTTESHLDLLEEALITFTNYRRIARYQTFIHCDYKDIGGTRRYYKSNEASEWEFVKTI